MSLAGLFVDDTLVPVDLRGLAAVALLGRDELDAAVAVPVVVPVHKRGDPQAGFLNAREWAACRADSKSVPGSLAGPVSMG
jgi:hypothetical protein